MPGEHPPNRKSIGEGELALSLEHGLSAGMTGTATTTETVEVARAGVNSNVGGHGVYNPTVAELCNLHHHITEPLDQGLLLSRISFQTQNLSEPGHAWVSLLWAGIGLDLDCTVFGWDFCASSGMYEALHTLASR